MDAVSLPPRADSSRYIGGRDGRSRASTVYMEDCNVLNNTALSYAEGGGIFVENSDLVMVRCNVSGNSAEEEADEGGGIYIEGTAMLSLTDTEVSDNSAGVGGGLYATGGVNVQLSNVRMTGNVATENSDSNDWIRGSSTVARCSAGQCIFGTECQSCNAPVGPAPAISPTAAPTAPTMAPTGSPTAPPTRSPTTSEPSPGPTAAPTFHPCTDGSHGCDVGTTYCAVRTDVPSGYTCECNAGFSRATDTACVITTNPTGAPTTAVPSTAPTTSAPSMRPTASPSLAPTISPTFSPENAPTKAPTTDDGNSGAGAQSGAQGSGNKASDNGDTIVIVIVIAVLMVIGTVGAAVFYVAHQRHGSDHAAVGFDNPAYANGPSTASMGGYGHGDTGHYSSSAPSTGGNSGYMDVAPAQPADSTGGYMDVAPTGGFDVDDAEDV